MQAIAGRKDYQSAWIFIHKDIILPKGEIISIIQKVEEVLSLDVEDKRLNLIAYSRSLMQQQIARVILLVQEIPMLFATMELEQILCILAVLYLMTFSINQNIASINRYFGR